MEGRLEIAFNMSFLDKECIESVSSSVLEERKYNSTALFVIFLTDRSREFKFLVRFSCLRALF